MSTASTNMLRFVDDHFGCRFTHLQLGIHFLDLRGLAFELGSERLYLLLLLRDSCLQALNGAVEHGLSPGLGDSLGPDAALGLKSTWVASIHADRAQSSVGVDHHHNGCCGRNRCAEDIVDSAPVADLAKNRVHTRVVADNDVVIGTGNTRSGHLAYGNVVTITDVALERLITNGCVVASSSIGSKRFPSSGSVGAASGIVRESKITSGSVEAAAVVKDKSIRSNGRVLCASRIEQERCRANCGIGPCIVNGQRSSANTGIEAAGRIQKERAPTKRGVSGAGGKRTKCVTSFRCGEIWKATIRCRRRCWRRRRRGCRVWR